MTVGTWDGHTLDDLYRGDVYVAPFGFVEDGGRVIDDLVLTASSTTATSATAVFTAADNGKKLTVVDGSGLADGTTITYVNATTVTLSAAASSTRTGVAALVRGLNLSAYSGHTVQLRSSEDAGTATDASVDSSRGTYGILELSLTAAQTLALPHRGVWDWETTSPDGVFTLIKRGRFVCEKDTTHA